jgi:hypothetical protein
MRCKCTSDIVLMVERQVDIASAYNFGAQVTEEHKSLVFPEMKGFDDDAGLCLGIDQMTVSHTSGTG